MDTSTTPTPTPEPDEDAGPNCAESTGSARSAFLAELQPYQSAMMQMMMTCPKGHDLKTIGGRKRTHIYATANGKLKYEYRGGK